MKRLSEKLKLIFVPFLVIAICFIVTYTLLDYVLFIRADLFHLKEEIVVLWLPMGLAFATTIAWLRPRLKLLVFKKNDGWFGYLILASIIIWVPTLLAQKYLQTATGKLTKLQNIAQYEKQPPTKYYSLSKHYVNKTNIGSLVRAEASGKHNQNLDLYVYITLPIFETMNDTLKGECSYWIGKKYSKTISNKQSQDEKEKLFDDFTAASQEQMTNTDFDDFVYLEKMGNTSDHDEFNRAINKSHLIKQKDPVVFEAVNEPFEVRNGSKGKWIFGYRECCFFLVVIDTPIK